MRIAYHVLTMFNETWMLGDETWYPDDPGGFYSWRIAQNGRPHPATCPACGRKTDPTYINPSYKVKKRRWDFGMTRDGYFSVSQRFRQFCEDQGWAGMEFVTLPADDQFFVLRLTRILTFDAARCEIRFEKFCRQCGAHHDVVGAIPVHLRGVSEAIEEGFFRSDLEFGSGHEHHPLILVGTKTAPKLRSQRFLRMQFDPVEIG